MNRNISRDMMGNLSPHRPPGDPVHRPNWSDQTRRWVKPADTSLSYAVWTWLGTS
jgi:hypothetical protein